MDTNKYKVSHCKVKFAVKEGNSATKSVCWWAIWCIVVHMCKMRLVRSAIFSVSFIKRIFRAFQLLSFLHFFGLRHKDPAVRDVLKAYCNSSGILLVTRLDPSQEQMPQHQTKSKTTSWLCLTNATLMALCFCRAGCIQKTNAKVDTRAPRPSQSHPALC